MHIYAPSLIPRLCAPLLTTYTSMQLLPTAVNVSFKAAIPFSFLMTLFSTRQIFNATDWKSACIFQEFVLWKSSPDFIAAAQLSPSTEKESWEFMFRLMQTLGQVTTEDKWGEWWCLQKNDQINWKRQNNNWIYNAWWCYLKGFITLSAWQLSRCISHLDSKLVHHNPPFDFFQFTQYTQFEWHTIAKTLKPPWSKHYIHIAVHNIQ